MFATVNITNVTNVNVSRDGDIVIETRLTIKHNFMKIRVLLIIFRGTNSVIFVHCTLTSILHERIQ